MDKYSKDREIAFLKETVKTLERTRPSAEWVCTLEQMVSARDEKIKQLELDIERLRARKYIL